MNKKAPIKCTNEFDALPVEDQWKLRYIRDLKEILAYLGKDLSGLSLPPSEALHLIKILIVSLKTELLLTKKQLNGEARNLDNLRQTDLFRG